MSPVTENWTRVVTPDDANFAPDVARCLLSLGFSDEEKSRYKLLASRDESDLTAAERSELQSLVHVSTVIALLQSKSRLSIRKHETGA